MSKNNIVRWVKKNRAILMEIIILIILLIIVLILLFIWMQIPVNDTIKSDMLGFWGSLLGGIIGGFATLIGVLLTLSQMSKSKKEEVEKEKPFIVPMKKKIYIYTREYYKEGKREITAPFYNTKVDGCDFYGDDIYINLINVGMKHALNISYSFELPSIEDVEMYFSKSDNHYKHCRSECIKMYNQTQKYPNKFWNLKDDNFNIQIIKSSELLENHVSLELNQELWIQDVIKVMCSEQMCYYFNEFPVGYLIFNYSDTVGKEQEPLKYKMQLSIIPESGHAKSDKGDAYQMNAVVIRFTL